MFPQPLQIIKDSLDNLDLKQVMFSVGVPSMCCTSVNEDLFHLQITKIRLIRTKYQGDINEYSLQK